MPDLHESQPRAGDEPVAPPLAASAADPVAAQFEIGDMYGRLADAPPRLRTVLVVWLFLGTPALVAYALAYTSARASGLHLIAAAVASVLMLPVLAVPVVLTVRWARARRRG